MEELDLKELLAYVWRKKVSIIVIVAISIIIGCIYTYNYAIPLYKSSATIILGKISSTVTGKTLDENITISESDLSLNSNLILTYSELIKSRAVMQEVKDNLNTDISVDALISAISVSRVNNSDLLSISASNTNPELAKNIVTEVVKIFSENIKEIYKIDNVYVIDIPAVASVPYNINHIKDIGIFGCVGIFIAATYVLLFVFLDNTVKSASDIEKLLNIKTLITIPFDKKKKVELITAKDSKAIISESFRTLRTNVQFSSVDNKGAQTLLITSCLPSEGKSYISANLAIAFAQTGKKVVLVDSDMRRGRQALIFNVPIKNGLSNYISNIDSNGMECSWGLGEYIKKTKIDNLDLITAGTVPPNPAELLESSKLVELVEDLKKYYDVVIFDGAPILPITDSLLLGRVLGKTMLVAVYNKTKKENLIKAKESIENVGGKIIGIALNKVIMNSTEYSSNYYYYAEEDRELTAREKTINFLKEKLKIIREAIKNLLNKIKSQKKRLEEGKIQAVSPIEEQVKRNESKKSNKKDKQDEINAQEKAKKEAELAKVREEERIKREEQRKILAEEREKQAQILAEEKAKKEAELAKIREEERIKKEEQRKIQAEEKAKKEAELAKIREEEKNRKAEEKAKQDAELAKKKEVEMAMKAEIKKQKDKENAIKRKEKLEQKAKRKLEWETKINRFKGKALAKTDEISEDIKAKKEEYIQKYNEYKEIKAEKDKVKLEIKAKRDAEIAKIREEERIKREEQRKILAEEREKQAQILAEEKLKQAEEKAKKDAEIAKIREEERIKREEQRKIQAEEKAKQAAILAEEKAKKEAELARIREEEKIRKEAEKAKMAEEKAKREAEAKLTDEYLEENLYPKTKYNKF